MLPTKFHLVVELELEGEWKISFENAADFIKTLARGFYLDRVRSAWDLSFFLYQGSFLLFPWKFYRLTDSVQFQLRICRSSHWWRIYILLPSGVSRCLGAAARQQRRLPSPAAVGSKNERRRGKKILHVRLASSQK